MTQSALPMRSMLETLQLKEFPGASFSQRVIGDRLFYVAEAADPHVASPCTPKPKRWIGSVSNCGSRR